jgi:hypothetical protein
MGLGTWVHDTNVRVARSPVGKWFRLEGSGHVSHSTLYMCDRMVSTEYETKP